ncbi:MAG: ATP-binding protein, partial [Bacteroidia bacterium]
AKFIIQEKLGNEDRILLGLSLLAHFEPDFFETKISRKQQLAFHVAQTHVLPTLRTAVILLERATTKSIEWYKYISTNHVLFQKGFLNVVRSDVDSYRGALQVSEDLTDLLLYGAPRPPAFSPTFPARLYTTALHWDDLVLPQHTKNQLLDTLRWLEHGTAVVEKLQGRLKPGTKTLFYGPPGTGKSMAAALLGKKLGRPVYRIDLSQIVSKYIGETEKNFAQVFDRAQHQNWILFFDEADSLFGKRTETRDAHDKYANQETSYLLMRLEEHDGPVILATNFKDNIDPAFSRRFTQIIYFPTPQADERLLLWKAAIPAHTPTDASLNLEEIARKYEISGAQIVNATAWCLLRLEADASRLFDQELLRAGIGRELAKEGRSL